FLVSQNQFAPIKCLRVTTGSVAFHATEPHQAHERAFLEPPLLALCLKRIHEETHLFLACFKRQWHEHSGLSQVAVGFRDLVSQNQMVAERVPGQFSDKAMVLMRILPVMSEDDIRRNLRLHFFENLLHFRSGKREETVRKSLQQRLLQSHRTDEQLCAP